MRATQVLKMAAMAFFGAGLVGCGSHVNFNLANTGDSFKQSSSSFTNQLDILWVVDNSGSMGPLQTNLTNNFGAAVNNFTAKGWDFNMAVTTTDAYLADTNLSGYDSANAGLAQFRDGTDATSHTGIFVITPQTPNLDNVFVTNATQGAQGSGDERAFSSFKTALMSPMNAGFLRPTSFFAVIILSDEDDFSGAGRPQYSWNNTGGIPDHDYTAPTLDSVDSYVNFLDTFTKTTGAFRRYNVSAITVLDQNCVNQHIGASPSTIIGQRYIQLAQETNGVLGSVCDTSFANSLNAIAQQIAVLSTQFYLTTTPNPSTIQVVVNGSVVPQDGTNGWTYNSAANSIMFHGSAIPPQGATINVSFTPTVVNH